MAPPSSKATKKQVNLFDFFSVQNKKRAAERRAAAEGSKPANANNNSNKRRSNDAAAKPNKKPKKLSKALPSSSSNRTTTASSTKASTREAQKRQRRTSLEDTDDEENEWEWWEDDKAKERKERRRQTLQAKRAANEEEEEDDNSDDNDNNDKDDESEFEANDSDEEEEEELEYNDKDEEDDHKTPVRKRTKTTSLQPSSLPPPQVSSTKTPSNNLAQFQRKITMSPVPPSLHTQNNNHNAASITPLTARTQPKTPQTNQSNSSSLLSSQQSSSSSSSSSLPQPMAAKTAKSTTTPSHQQQQPQQPIKKPPKPIKNVVNPMGSHTHHHLKFLHPPRDAQGRTPDCPKYDPRTLRVSPQDWQRVTGSAMTQAVQQWWDLKAQYFDTLLLFKTGKFYELYHMDADVGVEVLGLMYMKGTDAHAGFPEKAYGQKAHLLVQAGYKVARVEQTETPELLKQRKAQHRGGGKKPQVVNREVCSIVTLGTRTCGYLEQYAGDSAKNETTTTNAVVGPLLAIAERTLDPHNDTLVDQNSNATLCREFGVTLVDAPRGWVTLGQFQDDALCSHLQTLLAAYGPSEILYQGDQTNNTEQRSSYHQTLKSLFVAYRHHSVEPCRVEVIQGTESFPKSTALDVRVRKQMSRPSPVQPWNVTETLQELERRPYFVNDNNAAAWPRLLQSTAQYSEDNATALSSLGAALYYLQRNLIDYEILSMGVVQGYASPTSTLVVDVADTQDSWLADNDDDDENKVTQDQQEIQQNHAPPNDTTTNNDNGDDHHPSAANEDTDETMEESRPTSSYSQMASTANLEAMSLEGTTLHNLEVLASAHDNKVAGSLWSKLYHTKTPHGSRLLRAWLLRPLFRKADIDRRADAVEELTSGSASMVRGVARKTLAACGDVERLLSRVHTMRGTTSANADSASQSHPLGGVHPNERAVYYEEDEYTRRKVGDFAKALKGLEQASTIPSVFQDAQLQSPLLTKLVLLAEPGGEGRFPDIREDLQFFQENFDAEVASQGQFEPARGVDQLFDDAQEQVSHITRELENYKRLMCREVNVRGNDFKYINTNVDSKDKYLIELPASYPVPSDWFVKGKRGKGAKQVNKYRTPEVEQMVSELEVAFETVANRRAKALEVMFARFDAKRDRWAAVAHATAILDALCSLAELASEPGYTRPQILEYEDKPIISFRQARHPSVDSNNFIPNDLQLGTEEDPERVLLLSGPNMGGKSTLLRQTCLLSILAQIGSFVPAEECALTPIDRIYTRLGASDRILLGQSTFFVELSETASALRGATERSLVIMDELGRGTSTFDGTAIAHATVKALVERNKCLTMFATHYHTLLDDWSSNHKVRLGHMECLVEEDEVEGVPNRVTFLYSLGRGACPKSFGVNVARLAGLPDEVLINAEKISRGFETEMKASTLRSKIEAAIRAKNWDLVRSFWERLGSQG